MLGAVQPTAQQRPSPAKRRGGSAASSVAPGGGGGGAATRLRASLRRRSRPVRGLIFSAGAAAGFCVFELAAGENEGDSNKPIMGIVVPSLAFEFHGVQCVLRLNPRAGSGGDSERAAAVVCVDGCSVHIHREPCASLLCPCPYESVILGAAHRLAVPADLVGGGKCLRPGAHAATSVRGPDRVLPRRGGPGAAIR